MNYLWRMLAMFIASHPGLVDWLIRRAQRTPYEHITSASGDSVYMGRWWLFNPYGKDANGEQCPARWRWLPSVRIHHIKRADEDRDLHDHPWNARTIVLRGWYVEERPSNATSTNDAARYLINQLLRSRMAINVLIRPAGYTGPLRFGEYHRIAQVPPDGVWTLFITGPKRGTWGFLVDGKKVPWRTYLGLDKPADTPHHPI
jgi:hypothetical protein